uniref:Uncharacterized protein n=1 Tax=viral metagenome TaxID=1070528 RepID=A0A6H1ZH37_9ZZZZ
MTHEQMKESVQAMNNYQAKCALLELIKDSIGDKYITTIANKCIQYGAKQEKEKEVHENYQ